MGDYIGDWPRNVQFNCRSPNPKSQDTGLLTRVNPGHNPACAKGAFALCGMSEPPIMPSGLGSDRHRSFHCFTKLPTALKAQHPVIHNESCGEIPRCALKRFLVVDHSMNRTTFILSSGAGDPVHRLATWRRNPNDTHNWSTVDAKSERAVQIISEPIPSDDLDENNDAGMESEMHEDTEELDALLYSDNDGDSSEDDDVTSTGHSPSTTTTVEGTDEVASSSGCTKKRKLSDRDYEGKTSWTDRMSSAKPNRSSEMDNDAESGCADNRSYGSREFEVFSSNKLIRKEKIRETVSVLQTIIPDGEGKDAISVLDEAIRYLKSLRHNAEAVVYEAP